MDDTKNPKNPNRVKGGQKSRQRLLEELGSEEAVIEFYKQVGAKGGRKSRGGGFTDRQLASEAGRKGGKVSGYKWKKERKNDASQFV